MSSVEASVTPAKRMRLEDCAPHGNPIQRSAEFWFDDGSVVLQATSIRFRVHGSVLSTNSKYFKLLFDGRRAGTEPRTIVTIDGVAFPLLHVGYTDQHWENLFTFLYYPVKIKEQKKEQSFEFLASLLRLSRKFEFDHVRMEALQNFKKIIPATFSDVASSTLHIFRRQSIFNAINLALELNIQTVLPSLYFLCSLRYPMRELLDDFDESSRLHPRAVKAIISGRDGLRTILAHQVFIWTFSDPPGIPHKICDKHRDCSAARLTLLKLYGRCFASAYFGSMFKPTYPSESIAGGLLCDKCKESADAEHDSLCEEIWRRLPSFFHLAEWENLKDFGNLE